MVTVGIGFLLVGVGFFFVGMNMRPPGTTIRYDWASWGFFVNSTRHGRIVGFVGLLVFMVGLKILL